MRSTRAPEIQPDAVYYHLGLVASTPASATFPERIDFYDILPQGMEMLYLFAFAFGRHTAAKLVHFAFLIATAGDARDRPTLGISDTSLVDCGGALRMRPGGGRQRDLRLYGRRAGVRGSRDVLFPDRLAAGGSRRDYLIPAGLLAGFC